MLKSKKRSWSSWNCYEIWKTFWEALHRQNSPKWMLHCQMWRGLSDVLLLSIEVNNAPLDWRINKIWTLVDLKTWMSSWLLVLLASKNWVSGLSFYPTIKTKCTGPCMRSRCTQHVALFLTTTWVPVWQPFSQELWAVFHSLTAFSCYRSCLFKVALCMTCSRTPKSHLVYFFASSKCKLFKLWAGNNV